MKWGLLLSFLLISFALFAQNKNNSSVISARNIPFDNSWLFAKGNFTNAEQPNFSDANWRKLDVPHDWSIEDLPNQIPDSIIGPFDKRSIGGAQTGYVLSGINPYRVVSRFPLLNGYEVGYAVGGTGWYRKKFISEKALRNKQVTVYFDGVYMNSDVWLNGHHLGNHPYGYTPFYYDLTPYLKPAGQENVLAVEVRNEGRNSRWYSGSGIYRHVWLTVTEPVYIAPWGVFVTTPEVSNDKAVVRVKSNITNKQTSQRNLSLVTTIFAPAGKVVGSGKKNLLPEAGITIAEEQDITLSNPNLWSVEAPQLYKAVTEIRDGNRVIDKVETAFGIRSLSFSAQKGFLLNGKRVILKGGCIHHDNGPLGSAAIDRAEERKIEILKQNGFNAIRSSHNPPSRQLLDACDRLGMLVIDEAFDMWEKGKNPDDYHLYFKEWWQRDLEAMLLRDRNHPSIIMWSIGNEINERVDSSGLRITKQLADEVRRLDPTRPVTEAINKFWDHPGYKWDTTANAFALLDVGGYNYLHHQYETDHQNSPNRIMAGTESYPKDALENFILAEKHPYVIGDFVWTAFDYIGESGLGNNTYDSAKGSRHNMPWPWFNGYSGNIDLIGNKKTSSFYRDVVWRNKPVVMAVHAPIPEGLIENVSDFGWPDEMLSWTWPGAEGKSLQVRVFSRAPVVRLLLNGKVIGEQKIKDSSITAVFNVSYQPGTLKAVNVVNGKETDFVELKTTGSPKRLRLVADRTTINANRNDLSYVMVEVTDEKGQVVPNAKIPILFSISGAGEIAAVGNGSPTEMASYQQPKRNTWNGKCLAIVRPTGKAGTINLKTTAVGLTLAQVTIITH
ncbi:MAG: glycoside hydrolase family 2 TIM barrel-domain containing protein [Ferruginibacter sp.]